MTRGLWLGLVVALSVGGCKKKLPPTQNAGVGDPLGGSVDAALQVATVSPSVVSAGQAASVQVIGAGFMDGVAVQVGLQAVPAQRQNENVLQLTLPPLAEGTYDLVVSNPDGGQTTLRSGLVARAGGGSGAVDVQRCGSVVVTFATDSATLSVAAKNQLNSVMDCYTGSQGAVRLEGHADARGTTDYNVALSQRRGEAVRQYLLQRGVVAGRLSVTAWGEERPVASGSGENAWAQNRRVELILR